MRFNQVATLITFASLGMVHAQHDGHPEMDSSLSTKQVGFVSWPYFFNQWVDSQAIGDAPANYNENVHACYLKLEVQQPFPDLDERWAVVGLQNCPPALIDHFLLTLTFPEQTGVILTDNYLHDAQVSQSRIQKVELKNVDADSHDHLAFWLPTDYDTLDLALAAVQYAYEIRYPTPAPSVSTKYDVGLLPATDWYNKPPEGLQNGDFYQNKPEYGPYRGDIANYPSYREKTTTLPAEWMDACPGDFYLSGGFGTQSRMSVFYLRWTWTCPGHPVSETTTLEFGRSGHEAYDNSLPHNANLTTTTYFEKTHDITKPETKWQLSLIYGQDYDDPREFALSITRVQLKVDDLAFQYFNEEISGFYHIDTGRDLLSLRYYTDVPASKVLCGFYLWEQYYQTDAIDPFYYAPHENAPLGLLEPIVCTKK